jgi:hypothetical protein
MIRQVKEQLASVSINLLLSWRDFHNQHPCKYLEENGFNQQFEQSLASFYLIKLSYYCNNNRSCLLHKFGTGHSVLDYILIFTIFFDVF